MKSKLTIIILAVLIGFAGFYFYQKNIFSKEVLKLEILGPKEVELLQEVEYLVKYKNNGNIRLEEVKLIFEYPKHSVLTENQSQREEIILEDIYPGQENTLSFKARLLGKEGEAKTAKAFLSYRPKNLRAYYQSATTFTTVITKVPLAFEFEFPSKMEPEKEVKLRLNYFSNLNYPLSDLRIKIEYPPDFEFIESRPKALEETEWEIALLNRGEGGRIEILGKLKGEIEEKKIFQAKIGLWQEGEFVLLKEIFRGIEIIRPSLYVFQEINKNPQYFASLGDFLNYEIFFKNIGEKVLEDLFLIVNLEGEAFDLDTLKAEAGRLDRIEKKIFWDYTRVPELRRLLPLEEGKVRFWIKLKEELPLEIRNPSIKILISLNGLKEEFETKINSKLILNQKGYYQDEVFGNSGPIPPRVGGTTTYTIIWQVKNYYNNLENVRVKTILPDYVRLTGEIFPQEEKFLFNSETREAFWEIGDLEAGKEKILAFQIAFLPTPHQRGQTPEIIGRAEISGEDTWTGQVLEITSSSINTTLPDDPTVTEEQGIVR